MKIAVGSDHRGVTVRLRIIPFLEQLGHQIVDFGPEAGSSVDYPEYAHKVAKAVRDREVDRGVLVDGTGIGMCIAANKIHGVRAALCHDSITAELSRAHTDANVLCISADLLGEELIERMLKIWLVTAFDGGRHARRVDTIMKVEEEQG